LFDNASSQLCRSIDRCEEGLMPAETSRKVGGRLGLGFVHFLYDRRIYRFSDPMVGATIGREIFCLGTARPFAGVI
jgi:hypothetical protein